MTKSFANSGFPAGTLSQLMVRQAWRENGQTANPQKANSRALLS